MKFFIIGRTKILLESAKLLILNGHILKGVITAKEAPEYKSNMNDYQNFAIENNVPFLNTSDLSIMKFEKFLSSCEKPEIAISLNYPTIIRESIIDKFELGILNAHGGDLPRYKGNACQAWAIINGEERIGLCIHKMTKNLDSGDIISRRYLDININTRIGEVWNWMGEVIPYLFLQALENLEQDSLYFLEKQDDSKTLRCFARNSEDGRIDWTKSNKEILRLINASSEPYSGAFCEYLGKKMKIFRAELAEINYEYLAIPGQIMEIKNNGDVVVACGKSALNISEIEYNQKRMKPKTIIHSLRERLK